MGVLQEIVDQANSKSTAQTANALAGKFALSQTIVKEQTNMDNLPRCGIHLGPIDASEDHQDSPHGCTQNMDVEIKCWVIGEHSDMFELIKDANRAILGIQPDDYVTELILGSGFMKEINGNKAFYELSYHFDSQTKSE